MSIIPHHAMMQSIFEPEYVSPIKYGYISCDFNSFNLIVAY
jgi:RIO-like serine/threonine protein kinase